MARKEFEMDGSNVTGRRILLAEDNEGNRSMMLDMLSIQNHDVAAARNGREAVELACQHNPELILMDIRMPVMDGIEAIRRLRAMPQFAETPIIALTASVDAESVAQQVAAGCTAHIAKPVRLRELLDALARHLGT